ncbi:hypothetical protein QVD17_24385 [Tagetes erecta]|uniref:RNA helicase aquarius N-terminal domain-containing protein n=1 Tax=Tagetes erecta TaxID=13708 RepID=A0AAD8NMQ7_TARER|nr:hypothetical protein QVD17_24385 [Tagetes erecta]
MEFFIDLFSQLPTRRYFKPLVADVVVVVKCHLSVLYKHEKGKLFAHLVDLLQYYEGFEIDDNLGKQMTDMMKCFKPIMNLKELVLANIGAIHKRADLSKKLYVLSPVELRDLVCNKVMDVGPDNKSDFEKEELIVEAYTPPDPGPYPQDQPKQNFVRFTPTQVGAIVSRHTTRIDNGSGTTWY